MRVSLYQKMSVALMAVFIASACLLSWWSEQSAVKTAHQAEQQLHLQLATHLGADNPLLKEGIYDYSALKNLFHSLMILGPRFEFYFIAPNGQLLSYSAEQGEIKRDQVNTVPLINFIEGRQALPIYGDDPRDISEQKIFSAAPIYNGQNLQGYLYIIIGGQIYDAIVADAQQAHSFSQSLAFMFTVLVVFLLVLLLLLRLLTHPLKKLTANIRAFRQAGFDKSDVQLLKWPNAKHNELHELGQTFNDMAEQINRQFLQLQENDITRREMLTDLSHDLRTPLAALQGYLETIQLKGGSLSAQEHQRFIDIAFKNANQLKKLVDQIFELAHLDGGQVTVNLEAIPIAELLHDIAAKFQHKLLEKHIKLQIQPPQCSSQVYTDIAKLERVLSNLIDNAIRHCSEQGNITILVKEPVDDKQVTITVVDNGTGIATSELTRIFDARYRASNAVADNKEHGGLGLAITKKLLLLLETDIEVQSVLGKGTSFYFKLNKVY